jgi:putative acetyltransferase
MQIRQVDWDDAASVELRTAQQAEIQARYGGPSEPGPIPTGIDVPTFLVAFDDDGTPLGCGGLRRLDDDHAEIKRMFVHPDHRGSGVSSALLARLERVALDSGWSRLRCASRRCSWPSTPPHPSRVRAASSPRSAAPR